MSEPIRTEYLIIGGGLSGIGSAAMLHDEGIDDYLILEKADVLGGTWHHNTYPDVACDIPSPLYQFSFRMNPDWSRLFAHGEEIRQYLLTIAEEYDVPRHVRFGVEVLEVDWDNAEEVWNVQTTAGSYQGRFLLLATGSLHDVNVAEIEGRETFRGKMFHSAKWRDGYRGEGDRVAVIGTGASSIQLTPPLAEHAEQVVVFQRTPSWIQIKPDLKHSRLTRTLFRRYPGYQRFVRGLIWAYGDLVLAGVRHRSLARVLRLLPEAQLRVQVKDPELRRKLRPNYEFSCKRLLVSNNYYPAIQRPNVELIDSGVVRITENSVVAANGEEREVDAIVFATGFLYGVGPLSAHIRGAKGLSLAEVWDGSPRAYLGTSVAGFPNLALIWGPNTGTTSVAVTVEAQLNYLRLMLREMRARQARTIDVSPAAEKAFKDLVHRRTRNSVHNAGGCTSFYLDEQGNNVLLWPGSMIGMWRRMKRFDPRPYSFTPENAPEPAPASAAAR